MIQIIRITAIWCPSCIIMKQRYDELLKNHPWDVIDYDFDDDEDIVSHYHVGSVLPVVIIVRDSKEIKRIIGEKSKKELVGLLEEIVTSDT